MKTEYEALMEAALELESRKLELSRADGSYTSPAWVLVHHAQAYITKLADGLLRWEVQS